MESIWGFRKDLFSKIKLNDDQNINILNGKNTNLEKKNNSLESDFKIIKDELSIVKSELKAFEIKNKEINIENFKIARENDELTKKIKILDKELEAIKNETDLLISQMLKKNSNQSNMKLMDDFRKNVLKKEKLNYFNYVQKIKASQVKSIQDNKKSILFGNQR